MSISRQSFFTPSDDSNKNEVFKAYRDYLLARNGPYNETFSTLAYRESSLNQMNASDIEFKGTISQVAFDQHCKKYRPKSHDMTKDLNLILALTKINAGEAYGVEVIKALKAKRPIPRHEPLIEEVEFLVGEEEEYHTRILKGAAVHFGLQSTDYFAPPLMLRGLINAIGRSPHRLYHTILLASEMVGTFMLNWMLGEINSIFKEQPLLADALSERVMDILVDEVGHITYNRYNLGNKYIKQGFWIMHHLVKGASIMTPPLKGLQFNRQTEKGLAKFDFINLPEEVRRRAFLA